MLRIPKSLLSSLLGITPKVELLDHMVNPQIIEDPCGFSHGNSVILQPLILGKIAKIDSCQDFICV